MIDVYMLASGSSGNAVCIATENTRILIDTGLSGKRLASALEEVGINPFSLDGLLISHDHNDHVSGAGIISRRFGIPIYATELTWQVLDEALGEVPDGCRRVMPRAGRFRFRDLLVETFPLPHDAADPVGFFFDDGKNKVALATDLGYVPSFAGQYLSRAHCLIVEANHDEEMLIKGPYPRWLKQRVLSNSGHLSNRAAGESLAGLLSEQTRHVILAHLSEQNNKPSLALDTVSMELEKKGLRPGKAFSLQVADRYRPSCHIRLP